MTKHSHIGGSGAKRIIACPGSLRLYRELGDEIAKRDEASEYAREGSMLHYVMEQGYNDAYALIGSEDLGGFGVAYTEEHYRTKVAPAWQAFNEYVSMLGEPLAFEQEVRVHGTSIHSDAFGTADLIGRHSNVLTVLDWKFGDGVMVDVKDNEQGLFYAACALDTPEVQDFTRGVKFVDIVIVQPMRDSDEIWDSHRLTVDEVHEFADRMRHAIKQSTVIPTPYALGDHCRWCKAKLDCPAQRRGIEEVSRRTGNEDLGKLLVACERAEDFIKEVREEAFRRLTAGERVHGWKLVPKRAQRKWLDAEVAMATLRRVYKLKPSELLVSELVSPAQAEKLVKAKQKDPKDIAALVTAVSSGNTLAPDSDPRPAVPSLAGLGKLIEGR